MRYVAYSCLFSILSMLMFSSESAADSLSSMATVRGGFPGQQCSQSGTSAASCQASATFVISPPNPDTLFFGGSASAIASFGSLGTSASALAVCSAVMVSCLTGGQASAQASFEDVIAIANAPTSGVLDFTIHTSGFGFLTCTGPDRSFCGSSSALSGLFVPSTEVIDGVLTSETFLPNGASSHDLRIPFTSSGGVTSLNFDLGLTSDIICLGDNTTNCRGETNFFDTAQVTGVRVLDENGNVVSDAFLTSESGTDYNAVVTSTPEPGSLFLFAIGLFALVVLHRRLA